jgi:hypothetical protein
MRLYVSTVYLFQASRVVHAWRSRGELRKRADERRRTLEEEEDEPCRAQRGGEEDLEGETARFCAAVE